MITAFMVFHKRGYPADGSAPPYKLYFTTDCVSETEIKRDADRYGWKVVKVTLTEDLAFGKCEVL